MSKSVPSRPGPEAEPLLLSNRRRGNALEEGYTDNDGIMDDYPAMTAVYSRAGLLDIVAILGLIYLGMHAHKKTPYQREIVDHDDPAFSHPYHSHVRYPDWPWLPIIALVAPAIILLGLRLISIIFYSIMAIPAVERWCPRLAHQASGYNTPRLQQTGIRLLLVETAKWMYIDGFAIIATASLTYAVVETLKTCIGGFRPDFLSRCDWDSHEGKCTGDKDLLNYGRKAFPSGHAAYSFAAMTLLSCVLFHKAVQLRRSFFKSLLCFLPLAWAVRVSITRWQENRHGAMDLLAGTVVGTTLALVCFHSLYHCRICSLS